jgi:hypothetical protein
VHVSCIDEHNAVAITLTEGQRHASVPVQELLKQSADFGTIKRVTADRAYDGEPIGSPFVLPASTLSFPLHAHAGSRLPMVRNSTSCGTKWSTSSASSSTSVASPLATINLRRPSSHSFTLPHQPFSSEVFFNPP